MAIEIVDFPMKNGGSFHSYVSLPEGMAHGSGSKLSTPIIGWLQLHYT